MKKFEYITRGYTPPLILAKCNRLKYCLLKLFIPICIIFLARSLSGQGNSGPSCPNIGASNTTFEIPVIVHVMYDDNFQNVDYQTVVEMINTINDQLATVEIDGKTVDISLYLVENGTCTPGYERIKISDAAISATGEGSKISEDIRIKENTKWDVDKYLNIWILRRILWDGDAKPG